MINSLLSRRLVIVTGKGGVGKSAVAACLATLGARAGARTLVVELSGQTVMSTYLGGPPGAYEPVQRGENLYSLSITSKEGMEEYLTRELHSKRLYKLVFQNNYVAPFINAVPALEDLINTGKIMDLEREVDDEGQPVWDLIVVDGPPTGQGLNLLKAPQAIMDMTRVGPMYNNSKIIHDLLHDPARTAVCLATLPEEMPVNETIEIYDALKQMNLPMGPLFINEVRRLYFTSDEAEGLKALIHKGDLRAPASMRPALDGLLTATRALYRRVRLEREQIARLQKHIPLGQLALPKLLSRELVPDRIAYLSDFMANADERLG